MCGCGRRNCALGNTMINQFRQKPFLLFSISLPKQKNKSRRTCGTKKSETTRGKSTEDEPRHPPREQRPRLLQRSFDFSSEVLWRPFGDLSKIQRTYLEILWRSFGDPSGSVEDLTDSSRRTNFNMLSANELILHRKHISEPPTLQHQQ